MSKKMKLNLLLAIVFCVTWRASAQTIVEPLETEVALAGEIKLVHGYGPPGYGENKKTDAPITYWVLELPTLVNSLCTPEKPQWQSVDCAATKRLRLFFPTSPPDHGLELKAKALKGHKAVVSGILRRQDTVGEITPIYMNVTEIKPVQPLQNP
jgi:hypothetical protein